MCWARSLPVINSQIILWYLKHRDNSSTGVPTDSCSPFKSDSCSISATFLLWSPRRPLFVSSKHFFSSKILLKEKYCKSLYHRNYCLVNNCWVKDPEQQKNNTNNWNDSSIFVLKILWNSYSVLFLYIDSLKVRLIIKS